MTTSENIASVHIIKLYDQDVCTSKHTGQSILLDLSAIQRVLGNRKVNSSLTATSVRYCVCVHTAWLMFVNSEYIHAER